LLRHAEIVNGEPALIPSNLSAAAPVDGFRRHKIVTAL